jgi:hypothetical protein
MLAEGSKCVLPKTLGAGVQGGTCEPSGKLSNRAQCTVACETGFVVADGLTADDFVYTCLRGRLHVPAAHCRPESNGGEPKIAAHLLTMSLTGHAEEFGQAERTSLAVYIAGKLDVNAGSDLQLTFSTDQHGTLIFIGLILGNTGPQAIVDVAFDLVTRPSVDDSWPLSSFPLVSA